MPVSPSVPKYFFLLSCPRILKHLAGLDRLDHGLVVFAVCGSAVVLVFRA